MKAKMEDGFCDHIGILSYNAQRLVSFYSKNFGFKFTGVERLPKEITERIFGLKTDCCFFRLGSPNMKLEIFQLARRTSKDVKARLGIHHFGFVVENRTSFVRKLKRRKVPIIVIERNGHKVYFAVDPDGNTIEIREHLKKG